MYRLGDVLGGHAHGGHAHDAAAPESTTTENHGDHSRDPHAAAPELPSPQAVMGHGGHGGMSMAAMVADMRNRFLVALVFAIPILLWSAIGRDVIGFTVGTPFGLREDVWQLLLSLPVVFYASSIFFVGAVRALRARTLRQGACRRRRCG